MRRATHQCFLASGCLAAGLLLAAPAAAQDDETTDSMQMLAQVQPSVVKIYGAGGFTGVPAYGTGVIVHERGFILTAWSIALRTDQLRVVTHDGQSYQAEIWRADPGRGVALLKARSPSFGFQALRLAGTSMRPGQEVYTAGNPFGVVFGDELPAVMRGVVSYVGPPVRPGVESGRFPENLTEAIFTDVPNNPGTQGGPLLSRDGHLVGILGRLVESPSTNTIVNFAVPAHLVRDFVQEGVNSSEARPDPPRPVRVEPLPAVRSGIVLQRVHLALSPLAYVERVATGSAAHTAGIRPDDLVFRIDGRTVRDCRAYDEAMASHAPGDEVTLLVKRGDAMLSFTLVLEGAE
jgi:S1-C subfamily serine protease